MNNTNRKSIRTIIGYLRENNCDTENVIDELEDLLADEEEKMENIPESLQETERYHIMEESCEYLQEAIDELENSEEGNGYSEVIKILRNIDGV